jgi:hypothetical protein
MTPNATWRAVAAADSFDNALDLARDLSEGGHICATPYGTSPASWTHDGTAHHWD